VVDGTHPRGESPTHGRASRDWWALASTSRRAFRWALVLAVLLHAPLAPSLVPGWLRMLFRLEETLPPLSDEVVVPLDLDMGFEEDAEAPPAPAPPPPSTASEVTTEDDGPDDDEDDDEDEARAEATRKAKEKAEREKAEREKAEREKAEREKAEREKAQAAASASTSPSSPVPVASVAPSASPSAVASARPALSAAPVASASGAAPAPVPTVEDPSKLAGQPGAVQAKATNVIVYLATDVARGHELAPLLSGLLAKIPQWKELLGGTGLDPLRDFDHVWLTGPHMQSSRVVVAVVDYNVSAAKMKKAIESAMAVSKPPGRWLSEKTAPLGVLGDGGVQRVSLRPDKHAVIVAPAEAEEQLKSAKDLKFNKSTSTLLAMTMRTPWRGFMHTPVRFPKSIALLKLTLTPTENAFTLRLEASDESPEAAARSVVELADSIEQVRKPPILAAFFDKPSFKVDGNRIFGEVTVTNVQLRRILSMVESLLALQQR
jgi:hypothetical protein